MATKLNTVGLLGGMTWEASLLYYQTINARVRAELGGTSSAPILMHSFDFGPLFPLLVGNEWDQVAAIFVESAEALITAGAKGIVICANFPHMVADRLAAEIGSVPLLHIADFTGAAIQNAGKRKVGLLGMKLVMEAPYIRERIQQQYGIEVLIPEPESERDEIYRMLLETLPTGNITEEVKNLIKNNAETLIKRGAEGIILGSTDLGFVLKPGDVNVPLFDTNQIHADGVADWILNKNITKSEASQI